MIHEIQSISYCRDDIANIENYEEATADKSTTWVCHHRLETHNKFGKLRDENVPALVLKYLRLYYSRPASELVFMKPSDHAKLHNRHWYSSEVNKKHLASMASHAGPRNGMYGKRGTFAGKKWYHTNNEERPFIEGQQPYDWKLGRLTRWKVVDGKRVWYKKEDK